MMKKERKKEITMARPKLPTAAKKAVLNITVNPEIKTMIKHIAQEEKTTVSALISDILTNYILERDKALKRAKKRAEKEILDELSELQKESLAESEFTSILDTVDFSI